MFTLCLGGGFGVSELSARCLWCLVDVAVEVNAPGCVLARNKVTAGAYYSGS